MLRSSFVALSLLAVTSGCSSGDAASEDSSDAVVLGDEVGDLQPTTDAQLKVLATVRAVHPSLDFGGLEVKVIERSALAVVPGFINFELVATEGGITQSFSDIASHVLRVDSPRPRVVRVQWSIDQHLEDVSPAKGQNRGVETKEDVFEFLAPANGELQVRRGDRSDVEYPNAETPPILARVRDVKIAPGDALARVIAVDGAHAIFTRGTAVDPAAYDLGVTMQSLDRVDANGQGQITVVGREQGGGAVTLTIRFGAEGRAISVTRRR